MPVIGVAAMSVIGVIAGLVVRIDCRPRGTHSIGSRL